MAEPTADNQEDQVIDGAGEELAGAEQDQAAAQKTAPTQDQDTEIEVDFGGNDDKGNEEQEPTQAKKGAEAGKDGGDEPSQRAQRRIAQLTKQLATAGSDGEARKPYKPLDIKDGEYDPKELQQDRERYGEDRFAEGRDESRNELKQELFVTNLKIDGASVAREYPMLDERSDDFDPDLASHINELFLATVGWNGKSVRNPNVSYYDYVAAFMDVVDRAATSRNADTATNVARQASRTGIRPNAQRRRSTVVRTPSDIANMSDADWEKNKDKVYAEINKML